MALQGVIVVSTCAGHVVCFSSGNPNFLAKMIQLNNLGTGSVWIDISTTAGCSTGYQLGAASQVTWNIGGARGFSVIASTAAGSQTLSYLASR